MICRDELCLEFRLIIPKSNHLELAKNYRNLEQKNWNNMKTEMEMEIEKNFEGLVLVPRQIESTTI